VVPGDLVYIRFDTSFLPQKPHQFAYVPEDLQGRLCVILKSRPKIEIEAKSENCFVV